MPSLLALVLPLLALAKGVYEHPFVIVQNDEIQIWNTAKLSTDTRKAVEKLPVHKTDEVDYADIHDAKLKKAVLETYGLTKEPFRVISIHGGKEIKVWGNKLSYVLSTFPCNYPKPHLAIPLSTELDENKKNASGKIISSRAFYGLVLSEGAKVIPVPEQLPKRMEQLLLAMPDTKKGMEMWNRDKNGALPVLGLAVSGKEYFSNVDPLPDMSPTLLVFEKRKGKDEFLLTEKMHYPSCGS